MDKSKRPYSDINITGINEIILKGLTTKGYALIENLDQASVYDIIKSLGKPFVQESGEAHLVEYKEGFDDFRYSKSLNEIGPHSEYPYHEIPPEIQILFCLKPSDCQGGQTYTCNVKGFLETLGEEDLAIIKSVKIDFKANRDLKDFQTQSKSFPILTGDANNSYIFRFSHNLLYYGDINAKVKFGKRDGFLLGLENPIFQDVIKKFLEYFDSNKQTWNIPKNGLLLWNNHNLVHSRASYTDKTRKLVRYLISERTA